MKLSKVWKTGLAYTVLIIVLGLTALTYGMARLDSFPKGQEVVAQGSESRIAEQGNKQSPVPGTADPIESEQGELPPVNAQEQTKPEAQNNTISTKDFPSPVQVEPLRVVGNYFSENLNAYLFHAGTDYPLTEGAVIRATHGGRVAFAGPDPILGQKVEIDCGENWHVVYGGLDNLRVQQGDAIEVNDILGQIGYFPGADGVNDRTQLHYEVWNGDKAQVQ